MDANNLRALHCGNDRAGQSCRSAAPTAPRSAADPTIDLRDIPHQQRQAEMVELRQVAPAVHSYGKDFYRNRIPGSSNNLSFAIPACSQRAMCSAKKRFNLGKDIVILRRFLHRFRLPLHMHQATPVARFAAAASRAPGSVKGADIVNDVSASARGLADDLWLSRYLPRSRLRSAEQSPQPPGSPAASSSSTLTSAAPGRVDSPPTSMIVAPALIIRFACFTASISEL